MTVPEENPHSFSNKRWYDQDPALRRALEQLRNAPDYYQAQVALNIIKIIVEHQMEENADTSAADLANNPSYRRSWEDQRQHRRWYDVNETLSSAIQLLADCPEDLQGRLIPSIAQMIENTLNTEESSSGPE